MQDLNDLYYFAQVVAHGGFAPAGRALRQPKSKLSRRVAQLEARLGVRLIERSTRRFRVTEIGQAFHVHCRAVLAEVERAEAAVAATRSEPQGLVRFSAPTGMLELLSGVLPDFMARYPGVRLQVLATNRAVDLIEERIDVALRIRETLDSDTALTLRTLTRSRWILVAGPALAGRLVASGDIAALAGLPTLSVSEGPGPVTWTLVGPGGATESLPHEPRLGCSDFGLLRQAAIAEQGVALLPDHVCWAALRSGALVQVFPEWHAPDAIVHLVFTTRRGLPPAVRALIDHLAERLGGQPLPALLPAG